VHLIRTGGEEAAPADAGGDRLVPRLSADLPGSPLGITLRHPLAPAAQVPVAWPSVVRQPVRNDYPFLSSLDLGVRHLRVPAADLDDPLQRRRLALLRAEGVALTAGWLWADDADLPALVGPHREEIDAVELRLPGALHPSAAGVAAIARCHRQLGLPITLSPIVARARVAGKQLPRARLTYDLAELDGLDEALAAGARVDRVLCGVAGDARPWDVIAAAGAAPPRHAIGGVDWVVELTGDDDDAQVARVAEALFAVSLLGGGPVFFEPLIDLDRTMDSMHGLLDRRCNPRPAYHAARCLNTILFATPEPRRPGRCLSLPGGRAMEAVGARRVDWLVLPDREMLAPAVTLPAGADALRYRLRAGTSQPVAAGHGAPIAEPTLLRLPAGAGVTWRG
jgi:hypothetical protein